MTVYAITDTKKGRTGIAPTYLQTTPMMVGTVAVDRCAVAFGTARRGLGGLRPRPVPSSLYQCNSPPINGQCTNFILFDVAL